MNQFEIHIVIKQGGQLEVTAPTRPDGRYELGLVYGFLELSKDVLRDHNKQIDANERIARPTELDTRTLGQVSPFGRR
jgi:hypothetical protein